MTVRRSDNGTIVLDGICPVEDAEPLLQLLQATPTAGIDWTTVPPATYGCVSGDLGIGCWPRSAPVAMLG